MKYQRTGFGFDCHKIVLSENKTEIKLCGASIPSDYDIIAHSDGDVALHALTDAILGAIGEGDIGVHFPPTDDKWKDYDSVFFLNHALKLLKEKGGEIINIDITIVAETPKIKPHRENIIKKLSELLNIEESMIGLKGKTSEGLGIVGEKKAIVCYAVVSLILGE